MARRKKGSLPTHAQGRRPISELEAVIGYVFTRKALLEQALTHPSAAQEEGLDGDYQRLEFLGDSVVGFIVASELYARFPEATEGQLSKLKAELVSGKSLASIALLKGYGDYMRLGRGEELTDGRHKRSLLADTFEAIVGAVYCDAGIEAAGALVRRLLDAAIQATGGDGGTKDFKSLLQVMCQKLLREPPTYTIVGTSGPEHDAVFIAEVHLKERFLGRGEGRTKKAAEQAAAAQGLRSLEPDPGY